MASAITDEVAAERGYWSATEPEQLTALGFADYQAERVPALVIPVYGPSGEEPGVHYVRPDEPRTNRRGKPLKYEVPEGHLLALDVPRRSREHLGDPQVGLVITEGSRKVDSALSAGLECVVGLAGVWAFRGTNSKGGKALLADFEAIAFNGRAVGFIFDSDVMTKREVYGALVRVSEVVRSRGAKAHYYYLPGGTNGTKVGLDDYLAEHGLDDLSALRATVLRDPPGDLELVNAADVKPRTTRWLWEGRVPLGMLTLLAGLPGLGKTTLGVQLCADVTRGRLPGEQSGTPRSVLIASLEDTLEDTLAPRLQAADADLELVHFLRCRPDTGGALDLSRHLGEIERATVSTGAALLFVDPLIATLPTGKVNAHRDQDVRSVLAPLATMAEQHGTSVLASMHFSKAALDALLGVGGSIGFVGAARSVLVFGADPTDEQGYRGPARVLAHRKCNVGPIAGSLACTVGERTVTGWEGETIITSKVAFTGHSDVDADELVRPSSDAAATKLEIAHGVIRYALREGDWTPARPILDYLAGEGISERRAQEACTRLGIERRREAMGGPVQWRLSQDTAGQRDLSTENQRESSAVPRASGSQLVIRDDDSEETP